MPWSSLASNQTVSFTNLKDAVTNGYFVALTTIPTSDEQITKSDASTYANVDTAYGPYAAKASNQLVVKSNLRPISYSYTIYYEEACFYDGFYIEGGASTADQACNNALTITLYSPVSAFANGMKLFYDSACDNPWYGDTGGCGQYYKVVIAGNAYTFTYPNTGSTVQSLTICSTTTTTTTTATTYAYYYVTQYLNCIQNSAVGQYIMRVPSYLDGVTWWCGDDFYQYEFAGNISPDPPSYDVEAINSAISCPNLPC